MAGWETPKAIIHQLVVGVCAYIGTDELPVEDRGGDAANRIQVNVLEVGLAARE